MTHLSILCSVSQEIQGLYTERRELGKVDFTAEPIEPAEDLLELYCGAANHTVALAHNFNRVLCVELNKSLCQAGKRVYIYVYMYGDMSLCTHIYLYHTMPYNHHTNSDTPLFL